MNLNSEKIAVIGLGYVGLPLAVGFGAIRQVVGFDINEARIAELERGEDRTLETDEAEIAAASGLRFTSDPAELKACGVFIVTVPTPIDNAKRPDLSPLVKASRAVGAAISPGAVVIFESTVYPGCTEEICAPLIEQESGLRLNEEFFLGYSPERTNPGDRVHRLQTVVKVTSGSTPEAAEAIDALYASIVTAGTHRASSIPVAEAAKVIENTQRDLNIALMNELAIIFHKLGLDTQEVLAAASTKWNFLPFKPGLVGGHCIGVDPYYLTHRAQEVGYHPEVILAGRRINDGMAQYVADRVARLMMRNGFPVVGSRVLVMGLTFKENCPDIRNSKVIGVINALKDLNALVDIYDPWVDAAEVSHEYGLDMMSGTPQEQSYDAMVMAVGHDEFIRLGADRIRAMGRSGAVFFDVKGAFGKVESDGRL